MNAAGMLAIVGIGMTTVLAGCGGSDGSSRGSENQAPVASFRAAPDNGPAPLQVQFDASGSSDADGSVASYSWNFGDSTPAVAGVTASHTFQAPGTYTVTLTVKDNHAAAATVTRQVSASTPSSTTVTVPNVVGAAESQAVTAVTAAGLVAGTITKASSATIAAGRVISQSPIGGTSAVAGSIVDLIVSTGPPPSNGRFSVTVEPREIQAIQGTRAILKVTVARSAGFTAPVAVGLSGVYPGLTAPVVSFTGPLTTVLVPLTVARNSPVDSVSVGLRGSADDATDEAFVTLSISSMVPAANELIAVAVADGTLDSGTAVLYRLYAFHSDPRLPERYNGRGSTEEGVSLYRDARETINAVSADLQAQLRPFLLRPADPMSVWGGVIASPAEAARKSTSGHAPHLVTKSEKPSTCAASTETFACESRNGWISYAPYQYPFRVWAREDDRLAGDAIWRTATLLSLVYDPMTQLMGRLILDLSSPDWDFNFDSAIDLYLVDPADYVARRGKPFAIADQRPVTNWDEPRGAIDGSSSFVLLNINDVFQDQFRSALIHEFFHVLQNTHSYRCCSSEGGGRYWFEEASAVWAEAHFDRTLSDRWKEIGEDRLAKKTVHGPNYDCGFRGRTDVPLNASSKDTHEESDIYYAYIWPLFVEQETKDTSFMPDVWRTLKGITDMAKADEAIDRRFPFSEHFKSFALRNVNMSFMPGDALPIEQRFVTLDPLFSDGLTVPALLERPDADGRQSGYQCLPSATEYDSVLDLQAGKDVHRSTTLRPLSAEYLRLVVTDPSIQKVEVDFTQLVPADIGDVYALIRTADGWIKPPFDYSEEGRVTFCFDEGPTTKTRRGSFEEIVLVLANHSMVAVEKVTGTLIVRPESKPCVTLWRGTVDRTFKYQIDDTVGYAQTQATVTFGFHDPVEWPCTQGVEFCVRQGSFVHKESSDDLSSGCHATTTAAGPILPPKDSAGSAWVDGAASSWLYIYTDPRDGFRYYDADGDVNHTAVFEKTACHNPLANRPPYESPWSFIWWKMDPQVVPNNGHTLVGVYEQDLSPLSINGIVRYEWSLQQVRE